MYVPRHFANDDVDAMRQLISTNALGTLVTVADGGLEATHVPCILDPPRDDQLGLQFHLAAVNPICGVLDGNREILMIFLGPNTYISPDWYASQHQVPTWNYAAVHVYGKPSLLSDPALCELLDALSASFESPLPKKAWTTDKVPEALYKKMRKAIRGYHLPISRMQGKWKINQNRTPADRLGVVGNLRTLAGPSQLAVADVMEEEGND